MMMTVIRTFQTIRNNRFMGHSSSFPRFFLLQCYPKRRHQTRGGNSVKA